MAELFRAKYTLTKRQTIVVTEKTIILEGAPSLVLKRHTAVTYQRAAIVSAGKKERAKPALGGKGAMDILITFQNNQRLAIEWLTWAEGMALADLLGIP